MKRFVLLCVCCVFACGASCVNELSPVVETSTDPLACPILGAKPFPIWNSGNNGVHQVVAGTGQLTAQFIWSYYGTPVFAAGLGGNLKLEDAPDGPIITYDDRGPMQFMSCRGTRLISAVISSPFPGGPSGCQVWYTATKNGGDLDCTWSANSGNIPGSHVNFHGNGNNGIQIYQGTDASHWFIAALLNTGDGWTGNGFGVVVPGYHPPL